MGKSQLFVLAAVVLVGLNCLNIVALWLVRRASAVDTFEMLAAVRPLVFVNSMLLLAEWWNLFLVPVYTVAASTLAVAILTVVGPAMLLAWSGQTLTEVAEILRRQKADASEVSVSSEGALSQLD